MSLARELAEAAKVRRKRMGFVDMKPVVRVMRPVPQPVAEPVAEPPIELPEYHPVCELTEIYLKPRRSWAERKEIAKRRREKKIETTRLLNLVTANVCLHYDVTREDLLKYRRTIHEKIKSPHSFAAPKHIAFWLSRHVCGLSYPEIARYYRRDHTTVIYGVESMGEIIKRNPAVALSVAILRAKIIEPEENQTYWGA